MSFTKTHIKRLTRIIMSKKIINKIKKLTQQAYSVLSEGKVVVADSEEVWTYIQMRAFYLDCAESPSGLKGGCIQIAQLVDFSFDNLVPPARIWVLAKRKRGLLCLFYRINFSSYFRMPKNHKVADNEMYSSMHKLAASPKGRR